MTEQKPKYIWEYRQREQIIVEQASRIAELEDQIGQTVSTYAKRVIELEAIVDKLPTTADGVPVVPGMRVWVRTGCGSVGRYKGMYDDGYGVCVISDDGDRIPLMVFDNHNTGERAEIYSTKQAAEEASKQ